MFKPKNVLVPAAGALVLSFLVSIFSTGNFGFSLLRGFLFSLLFAALGFGISFINDHFLSVAEDSASSEDGYVHRSSGNSIDIVVGEENLTDDGDSPRFSVEHNRRTLADKDTAAGSQVSMSDAPVSQERPSPVIETAAEVQSPVLSDSNESDAAISPLSEKIASENKNSDASTGFMPVDLGKPVSKPVSAGGGPKVNAERAAQMKEIDDLPDLNSTDDESSVDEGLIETSDFATMGESTEEEKISVADGSMAKDHDTDTMAKAIRTLLKRE